MGASSSRFVWIVLAARLPWLLNKVGDRLLDRIGSGRLDSEAQLALDVIQAVLDFTLRRAVDSSAVVTVADLAAPRSGARAVPRVPALRARLVLKVNAACHAALHHASPGGWQRICQSAPRQRPFMFGRCSILASDQVELRGFEPLTPSMRTRCATGLRYSPWNASQRSKPGGLLALAA
jgi:hypothetical protein